MFVFTHSDKTQKVYFKNFKFIIDYIKDSYELDEKLKIWE